MNQSLNCSPSSGAVHLFAPHIELHGRYTRTITQTSELIFNDDSMLTSLNTASLPSPRLLQKLSDPSSDIVALFTGVHSTSTAKAIVGLYFPGPLHGIDETDLMAKARAGRNRSTCILFELQPNFRLLKCNIGDNFEKLIQMRYETVDIEEVKTKANVPYQIGYPDTSSGRYNHLVVDPGNKTVRLSSLSSDDAVDKACDTASHDLEVRNCKMEVFVFETADPIAVVRGHKNKEKAFEHEHKPEYGGPKVGGDELLKRIQGLGSRGEKILPESTKSPKSRFGEFERDKLPK